MAPHASAGSSPLSSPASRTRSWRCTGEQGTAKSTAARHRSSSLHRRRPRLRSARHRADLQLVGSRCQRLVDGGARQRLDRSRRGSPTPCARRSPGDGIVERTRARYTDDDLDDPHLPALRRRPRPRSTPASSPGDLAERLLPVELGPHRHPTAGAPTPRSPPPTTAARPAAARRGARPRRPGPRPPARCPARPSYPAWPTSLASSPPSTRCAARLARRLHGGRCRGQPDRAGVRPDRRGRLPARRGRRRLARHGRRAARSASRPSAPAPRLAAPSPQALSGAIKRLAPGAPRPGHPRRVRTGRAMPPLGGPSPSVSATPEPSVTPNSSSASSCCAPRTSHEQGTSKRGRARGAPADERGRRVAHREPGPAVRAGSDRLAGQTTPAVRPADDADTGPAPPTPF